MTARDTWERCRTGRQVGDVLFVSMKVVQVVNYLDDTMRRSYGESPQLIGMYEYTLVPY